MISSVSDLLAGTLHGVKGEAGSRFFSRRWYLNLIGLLLGLLVLGGILGAIAVPALSSSISTRVTRVMHTVWGVTLGSSSTCSSDWVGWRF